MDTTQDTAHEIETITPEDEIRLQVKALHCLERRIENDAISDLGLLYILFGPDVRKDWLLFQHEED